ncbi:MAG: PQQ-dependent sugar dehydrogenase, partial [Deltaproteobacteria bacterium]|nr:PQQ-dependent sugar dehydrogenase [Deltaproteobacteria bacterium]
AGAMRAAAVAPRAQAAALAPSLDPIAAPIVVGDPLTLSGAGFTAGAVIRLFVATANGPQAYGPFTPSAFSATSLNWDVAPAIQLGNGFGTVLVINTDQNFATSNAQSQLLFGDPSINLPTITQLNGVALRPVDPTIPIANVETIVAQGSTLTITGTGFNNPLVNLFTASGNVGPLTPLAGGSATQIQVTVPMSTPTGPGSLQVVNNPYTGNVLSNAVSVPIGAPIGITSITQNGRTVTVNGAGFSTLTVLNLFNLQGGGVANLGGLFATNGQPRVRLTFVSSTQLTFQVPAQGIAGPAFVQALNPPFIPFSSSGNDPDGGFSMAMPVAAPGGSSLRFNGTGSGDIDRVKIALDAPARPVDVGGDFTLEWWMKTSAGNSSGSCTPGADNWINGNILIDRDVFGGGDFGDFGVSLFGSGGVIGFGVALGASGNTICGSTNVANGAWHHVAVVRSGTTLRLFVDGALDASGSGPSGNVGYRDGRSSAFPNSDPFLVLGAEKHDAGASFPSYHGWLDELRVSSVARYGSGFTPPSAPFTTDAATAALYHFDEGNGLAVLDTALASGGPSHGVRRVGGAAAYPQWSTDTPFSSGTPVIALTQLTNSLSAPTSITNCGDNRLFITEQGGAIRIWNGTQLLAAPFLTVPVGSGGERGLLSLAFHPQYAVNGLFYVYYTAANGDLTIARYRVSGNPDLADAASGVTLLTISHPASNHNGGQLQFGPDGYLYAGIGDGGGGCDDQGAGCNAQRDGTLLGKLLRLDVDQNLNTPPYYGIPPSNPFIGGGDPLDQIWAKGVRNPWRFSFDRLTGGLFIGEVGQGAREEVDYQDRSSAGGENYGWKFMEGSLCGTCSLSGCSGSPACPGSFVLPILEYGHSPHCSITGGYAYRGTTVPFLAGAYLYGDLCSGTLWWGKQNNNAWTGTPFSATAGSLYSFGEDRDGELYLTRGNGQLLRVGAGP